MKKGVVISIIISVILTLTLAIATIATAFGGVASEQENIYLAYRTGDHLTEFKNFASVNFVDSDDILEFNEEYDCFVAKKAGVITGASVVKTNGQKANLTIEVFEQGDGSSESSPWVVANASHVAELSGLNEDGELQNDDSTPFIVSVKANIDMSGVEFMPIGYRTRPFTAKILGNGKTISNINIEVNSENYAKFIKTSATNPSDKAGYMDLGFIGYSDNAEIVDLGIGAMKITVANNVKEVVEAAIASGSLTGVTALNRISIGAIVGYAQETTITNVSNAKIAATLRGYSYVKSGTGLRSGMGGVVAVSDSTVISGVKVNANIIATSENSSMVGGVVGCATYFDPTTDLINEVTDCQVTLVGNTVYNNKTSFGGIVGEGLRILIDNDIVNASINGNEKFNTIDIETYNDSLTMVGGVAGKINDVYSMIKNTTVISAINVKSLVGGVAGMNKGTIINCSVSGNLTGYAVGGVCYNNENGGSIRFDEDFSNKAVNATIKGVEAAGVSVYNHEAVINGAIEENKAKVEVKIVSAADPTDDNYLSLITYSHSAGLVAYNEGTISNFEVEANLEGGLNLAGIVGVMRSGLLDAVSVNVNMKSNNYSSNNVSTTYSIAGAVGFVNANSTINGVSVNVQANSNAVSGVKYGASEIGGLIARIYEDNVTVTNNTVSGNLYANYSKLEATVDGVEGEHKIMLAGGLIGSIAGRDVALDSHKLISLAHLTLNNNTVENLTIEINLEDGYLSAEKLKSIRSVGALVGTIANSDSVTIQGTYSIENLILKIGFNAFTYNIDGGTDTKTFIDNGNVNVYGSAAGTVVCETYQLDAEHLINLNK